MSRLFGAGTGGPARSHALFTHHLDQIGPTGRRGGAGAARWPSRATGWRSHGGLDLPPPATPADGQRRPPARPPRGNQACWAAARCEERSVASGSAGYNRPAGAVTSPPRPRSPLTYHLPTLTLSPFPPHLPPITGRQCAVTRSDEARAVPGSSLRHALSVRHRWFGAWANFLWWRWASTTNLRHITCFDCATTKIAI